MYRDTITLSGIHIHPWEDFSKVYIGGLEAKITSLTDTSIKVLAPDLPPGSYPVRLNIDTFDEPVGNFTYRSLDIVSISHDTIRLGDKVIVQFNDAPSDITSIVINISGYRFRPPYQDISNNSFYFYVPLRGITHGDIEVYFNSGSQQSSLPVFSVYPFSTVSTRYLDNGNMVRPFNSFVLGDTVFVLMGSFTTYYTTWIYVDNYSYSSSLWGSYPNYAVNWSASFVIDTIAYSGLGSSRLSLPPFDKFHSYNKYSQTWEPIADYPGGPTNSAVAFSSNGFGYVGSGTDSEGLAKRDFWRYDPASDAWLQLTDIPGDNAIEMFSINGDAWVFLNDGNFFKYHINTDSWEQMGQLPQEAQKIMSFVLNSKVYIGFLLDNITQFYEYNAFDDSWSMKTKFWSGEVAFHNTLNNKGIFHNHHTTLFKYDPEKDF